MQENLTPQLVQDVRKKWFLVQRGEPTLEEKLRLCLAIVDAAELCELSQYPHGVIDDYKNEKPPVHCVDLKAPGGLELCLYRATREAGGYYVSAHPFWPEDDGVDDFSYWLIDNQAYDEDENPVQDPDERRALKRIWMAVVKKFPQCRELGAES